MSRMYYNNQCERVTSSYYRYSPFLIHLLKHRLLGLAPNLREKPPTAIHVDSSNLKRPLPPWQPPLLQSRRGQVNTSYQLCQLDLCITQGTSNTCFCTLHCMEHKHGAPRANTLKALESYHQRCLRKNLEFRWTDHVVRMPDSCSPTQVFSTTSRPKGTGRSETEVRGSV